MNETYVDYSPRELAVRIQILQRALVSTGPTDPLRLQQAERLLDWYTSAYEAVSMPGGNKTEGGAR